MSAISLDFSRSFCGRQEELQRLKASFAQACRTSEKKDSRVYIEGVSGSGKSALIDSFRESISAQAFFGRGKLEEGKAVSEPFAAIADAVQEIVKDIAVSKDKEVWKERIQAALEGETTILASVLHLGDLVDRPESSVDKPKSFHSNEKEFGFERLRFAFRSLLRAISSHYPVVLAVDDLQWAGRESLVLIETLLADRAAGQFLFIGAFRPVDPLHPLIPLKKGYPGVEIMLGSLSSTDINQMICQLLRRESNDTGELVEVVVRKTGGNAFFVVQFLALLEKMGLLQYSLARYRWEWDIEGIKAETDISDNVATVVATKVRESPAANALMIAACLGVSHFDVQTLQYAMRGQVGKGISIDELDELLRHAAQEGFVEELSALHYKFAHDRIREGAYSLLPTDKELSELQLQIGRQLRVGLSDRGASPEKRSGERLHYLTVHQLNAGSEVMTDLSEKRDLAELNYRAAKLTIQRASFFPAVEFLQTAVRLLGNDPWQHCPDFMLQILTALARALYSCGRLVEAIAAAEEVLDHAKSFQEKNTVVNVKLLCLVQQGDRKQAIDMVLSALAELGFPFPRRFLKFHVLRHFMRAKAALNGKTDEELLNLPMAHDENISMAAEFLVRVGEIGLYWGLEDLVAICLLYGIQMTIKYGRLGMTSMTFMAWGFILIKQGDFDEAHRFGRLGLQLAKELKGGTLDHRAVELYYTWIWLWKEPLHDGLTPFSNAMKALWDGGALECVFNDVHNSLRMHYCCGLRLQPLLDDVRQFYALMKDYRQVHTLSVNLPFLQMVSNLTCEGPRNALELTGEFMSEQQSTDSWTKTGNNVALQMLYFVRLILASHFDELELAGDMSAKVQEIYLDGAEVLVPFRFFLKGLAAISMAKRTGKHDSADEVGRL